MKQINLNESKLVVITRQDINPGYQCVQGNHSLADFAFEHPETFKKYPKKKFSRAQIKADEKEHIFIPIQDLKIISLKEEKKQKIIVEFN